MVDATPRKDTPINAPVEAVGVSNVTRPLSLITAKEFSGPVARWIVVISLLVSFIDKKLVALSPRPAASTPLWLRVRLNVVLVGDVRLLVMSRLTGPGAASEFQTVRVVNALSVIVLSVACADSPFSVTVVIVPAAVVLAPFPSVMVTTPSRPAAPAPSVCVIETCVVPVPPLTVIPALVLY